MVLTREEEDAVRIKVLALHGMSKDAWKRFGDEGYKHYSVVECGFKYNMMDLQAAIGIHQLQRIERYWQRRREIWQRYNEAFSALPIELPAEPAPETRHAYHLYTIMVDRGENRHRTRRFSQCDDGPEHRRWSALPEHPRASILSTGFWLEPGRLSECDADREADGEPAAIRKING